MFFNPTYHGCTASLSFINEGLGPDLAAPQTDGDVLYNFFAPENAGDDSNLNTQHRGGVQDIPMIKYKVMLIIQYLL